jgi:hypothetical protein
MGMYLEKEEVVAQFQKTQSQNQQNLSVKNPKHQAGIEAAEANCDGGGSARRNRRPARIGSETKRKSGSE